MLRVVKDHILSLGEREARGEKGGSHLDAKSRNRRLNQASRIVPKSVKSLQLNRTTRPPTTNHTAPRTTVQCPQPTPHSQPTSSYHNQASNLQPQPTIQHNYYQPNLLFSLFAAIQLLILFSRDCSNYQQWTQQTH